MSAQVQGTHSILGLMMIKCFQSSTSHLLYCLFILVIKNVYTLLTLVYRFTSVTVGEKIKQNE